MSIEVLRKFFLWCTIVDSGILMLWFLFFAFGRDWMKRIHGRWFHLSSEQFDSLHYALMGIFKMGIILFNLAPLVALYIIH